jgi:hypothetical protein
MGIDLETLEHDVASYERSRHGTTTVEEFVESRPPVSSRRESAKEIGEAAFFSSRGTSNVRGLNHLDSVFSVDSGGEGYIAKFCLSSRNEVRINQILTNLGCGVNADFVAVENDVLAIFARHDVYLPDKNLFANLDALDGKISALGELLARIHRVPLTSEIPVARPKLNLDRFFQLNLHDYMQLPGLDIQAYVEALQGLQGTLRYLRLVAPDCFIHGDFKMDNVVMRQGQPVAIDWETAGRGHREADLGVFIASIVTLWLQEKAKTYAGQFENILSAGDVSTRQAVMLIAKFVDAYRSGATRKLNMRLLGLYVGIFLLNRGYVSNMLKGRFDLESLLCFKLGQSVARKPLKFIRLCIGLARSP